MKIVWIMSVDLRLGDCLDLFKEIQDESIDLVVTDCPYKIIAGGIRVIDEGNDVSGIFQKRDFSKTDPKGRRFVSDGTKCSDKWLKQDKNNTPSAVKDGKMFDYNDIKFNQWLPELFRVLKKGTHCYIMVNSRNLKDLQVEAEKVGFEFQNLLIWQKNNATPNKYYMQAFECILMLSKRPAKNINDMGRNNILSIPNIIGKKVHPTQKPVNLNKILIEQSSKKGDLVLDPFMGCGSCALACKDLKRDFIGFEIDKEYFDIANNLATNHKDHFLF